MILCLFARVGEPRRRLCDSTLGTRFFSWFIQPAEGGCLGYDMRLLMDIYKLKLYETLILLLLLMLFTLNSF